MKWIKNNWSLTLLLFVATVALGAGITHTIQSDNIRFGIGTSTDEKAIEFNTGDSPNNVVLGINDSKEMRVTTLKQTLGDGTDANVTIVADQATVDGFIRKNSTSGKWEFSNDGTSVKDIGSGGGGGGVNVAKNPDLEAGDPPDNYTESGGALSAETTNPLFDSASGRWDASAGSQTLTLDLSDALTDGFTNQKCQAEYYYTWAGTPGDLTAEVRDSTQAIVAAIDLPVTVSGDAALFQFPQFDCPDAGEQLQIVWRSTGDAVALVWDNVFLGTGRNTLQISQSELIASAKYNATASCTWGRDNASFGAFSADADCPSITVLDGTGSVDTTDDDLPTLVLQDLGPGIYTVDVIGHLNHDSTAAGIQQGLRLVRDGSTIGGDCGWTSRNLAISTSGLNVKCQGSFTLTSTVASTTIEVYGYETGTGSGRLYNIDSNSETSFVVRKYPTQSASAITLETVGERWNVNIGGAAAFPDLGVGDVTSYTNITDAGLDMVINTGSKTAQIPCSATNPSNGLTCSASDESIGIVIDISSAGTFRVCGEFTHRVDVNGASGAITTVFQWVETPNNAQTILQEGNARIENSITVGSSLSGRIFDNSAMNVCGDFVFSSPGQKTLRLMYEQDTGGTTPNQSKLFMDRSTAAGQRDMNIRVNKLDQQMPTPVFTDLTDSLDAKVTGVPGSSLGVHRITSALIDNAGTPTVFEDFTGTGTSWIDNINDEGVGQFTITYTTNVFDGSTNVSCTCSTRSNDSVCRVSSGATTVAVRTYNTAASFVDTGVNIQCYGVKGTLN